VPAAAPAAPAAPAAAAAPVKALTGAELAAWYEKCWAQFNVGDWDNFSQCYAENATSESIGDGRKLSGRAAIIAESKAGKVGFPDQKGDLALVLVNGNNVFSISVLTGTNSGPMASPQGPMPATNKKIGLLFAHGVQFDAAGKVEREYALLDSATMLAQLGVAPGPSRPVMAFTGAKEVVVATGSEAEAKTLGISTKMIEVFNKHDLKAAGEMFADDFTEVGVASPADIHGKQAEIKETERFFKAMPDAAMAAQSQWAAGDYVVTMGTFTGTNTGGLPAMKIPKNGKKVSMPYVQVDKIKDGKVAKFWIFYDGMAFATQLGAVPPPAKTDAKGAAAKAAPAAAKAAPAPAAAPAKK
jgi:predicted ester cyclase